MTYFQTNNDSSVNAMKKIHNHFFTLLIVIMVSFAALAPITASAAEDYYIVNKSSKKFHIPSCSYLPKESNSYTIRRSEINKPMYSDLSPCSHCDPLNNYVYEPENSGSSGSASGSGGSHSYTSTPKYKSSDIILFIFILLSITAIIYYLFYVYKKSRPNKKQ